MDREHYWLLANALTGVLNTELKYDLVLELCNLLKSDNPKFDTDLFLDACEYPPHGADGDESRR